MGAKVAFVSQDGLPDGVFGAVSRAKRGYCAMMGRFRVVLAFSALALALGGCGVKGSLETPKAQADATAEAQSGQGKPQGAAPKPHKGFVLDGLLR